MQSIPQDFPGGSSGASAVAKALRRELRARRRALSPGEQRRHGAALCRVLGRETRFLRARRIAAYWPADGEMDPRPLLDSAIRRGSKGYLPVLRPGRSRKLWFVRYRPGEPLRKNRFGIPEPRRRQRRLALAWALDLILTPLVGFDGACNRLGMGGGFYDRSLGYLRHRTHWHRPRLVGIAHACQQVERLSSQPWDIALDAVATETRVLWKKDRKPPTAGLSGPSPIADRHP